MEEPKELILPSALIALGLFIFITPLGESDFEPLKEIFPYLCSAPFMLAGCFILSKRMGAVDGPKLSLTNNLLSTEEYLEYKEKEKARDQQSIGYMIMLGSATSAAFIFTTGMIVLLFIAAMSFGSSSNDSFNSVLSFVWSLLKICFWIYVGSHALIARPWQYFGETGEEKPVEEKRLVQCPACDATMRVPVAYEGRAGCPACGEEFKA